MQKTKKADYSAMTLRLPSELMKQLDKAAEHNGRTRSDEIRSRLEVSPIDDRLAGIEREMLEMKAMLRKLWEAAG
jgi:predicted DNA-binding protein